MTPSPSDSALDPTPAAAGVAGEGDAGPGDAALPGAGSPLPGAGAGAGGAVLPAPLLPRVAAGEAEAVRLCIDRYSGLVWSLASRMLGGGVDVEDLVQDIFVELWQKADRYDPQRGKEATFVAVLTRRRVIDRLRRRGVRPDLRGRSLDAGPLPAAGPDPAAPAELADEMRCVSSAMARLKPDQQRALRLAVCDGLTHDETARALNLPLGTVKTHVRRGLIRLRQLLDDPEPVRVASSDGTGKGGSS